MKYMKKKFFCLLLIMIIFTIIIPKNEFAVSISGIGDLDNYNGDGGTSSSFNKMANNVVAFVQIVGSIISVVVLIVLGIKYMFGSIEERAEYKKTMLPYLIGAIMVFGISNVVGILYYVATNVFS